MDKCTWGKRAKTQFGVDVGCPLDHCQCGTHGVDHKCKLREPPDEEKLAAGWDPNP